MTERQRRFVAEYIKDGNATQAAKRAGFSKKTAGRIGGRLLKNVLVASAIEASRGPVLLASQITLESHLAELAKIRDAAYKAGQFGPANQAEANRGKVAGYYVDRLRVEDLRNLPDAELEMIAAGRAPN